MSGRNVFKKYSDIIRVFKILSLLIPKFIFDILYFFTLISNGKISIFIRFLYVNKYAKSCGDNIYIGSHTVIKNIKNLEMGSNISIHSFSYIDAVGGLSIGDNVSIATQTSIITFDHTWEDKSIPIKYNKTKFKKIIISDDVWVGANVNILGGTNISSRSIVAAGAVVNKNVDANTVVGGVPIKILKKI